MDLLRGLLVEPSGWKFVIDVFLLNAFRNTSKNVHSLGPHKEACAIWLTDLAIFDLQEVFNNFVSLKYSGSCPSSLRCFLSAVMGLFFGVRRCYPSVVFLPARFYRAHAQEPF